MSRVPDVSIGVYLLQERPPLVSQRQRILDYVAEEPGSTPRDVAADLGLDPSSTASQLNKLYKAGRVDRQRMPQPGTKFVYAYRVAARSP